MSASVSRASASWSRPATHCALTADFDIELIATNLYDIKLPGGRTADLAKATERKTGETFPGFARTETGTWMLALTCSKCQNPAPVLLTIIEPSAGGT